MQTQSNAINMDLLRKYKSIWFYILILVNHVIISHGSLYNDNHVAMTMVSNWPKPSFRLQLVETLAGYNESLYFAALAQVLQVGVSMAEDSDDEFDADGYEIMTDEQYYSKVVRLLDGDEVSFFDLYLANNYYSPRIITHFNYYNQTVFPYYRNRLAKCFGGSAGVPSTWVLYNGEILCSSDDIFALKSAAGDGDADSGQLLPFDRVIGLDAKAPLAILYGDIEDPAFREYFLHLCQSAKMGKVRFVVRYVGPSTASGDEDSAELLAGYGVELRLKRTDYIVIDDRDIKKPVKNLDGRDNERVAEEADGALGGDSSPLGFLSKTGRNIKALSRKQLKNLDLKVCHYILHKAPGDGLARLRLLKQIVNNLPKYAYDIATSSHFRYAKKDAGFAGFLGKIKHNRRVGDLKGLYVNGKKLGELSYSLFGLMGLLKAEKAHVGRLEALNVTAGAAKAFISEFARLSGSVDGAGNRRRYDINTPVNGDSIVYLNDLETDARYADFTTDQSVWKTAAGGLPRYKENVLQVVFAINMSNRRMLGAIGQTLQIALSRRMAHRIGIVPIVLGRADPYYSEVTGQTVMVDGRPQTLDVDELRVLDRLLASDLYEKAAASRNFDFLAYLRRADASYYGLLWKRHLETPETPGTPVRHRNAAFVRRFSLDQGYIIVDGVFHPFNVHADGWQQFLSAQLALDVQLVAAAVDAGYPRNGQSIKEYLYSQAEPVRDTTVVPQDPADVHYALISAEYLNRVSADSHVCTFVNDAGSSRDARLYQHLSLTLAGDFGTAAVAAQLAQVLRNEIKQPKTALVKYRLVNTGSDNTLVAKLQQLFGSSKDWAAALALVDSFLQTAPQTATSAYAPTRQLLESVHVYAKDRPIIMLNSRVLELQTLMLADLVGRLFQHERKTRLFRSLYQITNELGPMANGDKYDWYDLFFSVLTRTYYETGPVHGPGIDSAVPRLHLGVLDLNGTCLEMPGLPAQPAALDIVVLVDPLQESSQKLVSLAAALENVIRTSSSVNLKVCLAPKPAATEPAEPAELGIKRLYSSVYLPQVTFLDGNVDPAPYTARFDRVPDETLFTLDLDLPHAWIALPKRSVHDLDNLKLDLTQHRCVDAVYQLQNIIIEGYAATPGSLMPPHGVQLELRTAPASSLHATASGDAYSDTSIMANYGYFQLQANPGVWQLSIKPNSPSSKMYSLVQNSQLVAPQGVFKDSLLLVTMLDMNSVVLFPEFTKNPGQKDVSVGDFTSEDRKSSNLFLSNLFSFLSNLLSFWKPKKQTKVQAEINIFAVASGHLYERLLSIMTASVRNHTQHSVKFWLIDNYMSANFKEFLPTLAARYNFQYELVTYKWPLWLRGQREKQRTIWGYKILFLDVLFPQDLDKVIFVDADQIVRADLKELVDLDLQGAPYGYVPMCDSRTEMEGFRFWKKGYWKTLLERGNKPYHISALYVVDLKKFRSIAAGDRLRQHYQQLSADPNSLSNLDQDLPNNLQYSIKIHSLDQDWLWCETWCSDESLKSAKTIDLCNNPLTKEPKLDRARRQIPEWSVYDNEIAQLMEMAKKKNIKQKTNFADIVHQTDTAAQFAIEDEQASQFHDEL